MIVSDASILILFSKINRIDLILDLFGKPIIIEEEVKKEAIDSGIKEGHQDAFYLSELVDKKIIKVKKARKFTELTGIHIGEAKTIGLALELKQKEILIDEEDGRIAAKVFGLTPRGTLFVLFQLVKRKKKSKKEVIEILNKLIRKGYRLSSKYYLQFLEKMEKNQ